ncbi:F-box/FBD/LRR-repeat protein At1g13570 [Linum grandiflorum]
MSIARSADRFSGLPDEIRHHVLNFLPLKDAVISSVLSTEWKNSWSYLPSLRFDDREIKQSLDDVCRILTRHRGPLKEFSLSLSRDSVQNDEILNLLPRRTITSLTIGYFDNRKCTLPMRMSTISSFVHLETLRLSHCLLDSPPGLFDKLTVLELRHVKFFSNSAAPWRFVCPLLTTLTLESIELPAIVIEEAPKLSCFHLEGDFGSLQFSSCTPLLKEVFIRKRSLNWTVESDLLKVNGGLAAVESLSVGRFFYEYLATGIIPNLEDIRQPRKKLRRLRLDEVCLRTDSHVWSSVCMIIASPNLQQLSIQMSEIAYSNMEGFKGYDAALRRMQSGAVTASKSDTSGKLTRVEVKTVKGTENELAFIKWLLSSSPALDIMKIHLSSKLSDAKKILTLAELNGFARPSTKALIKIESLDWN